MPHAPQSRPSHDPDFLFCTPNADPRFLSPSFSLQQAQQRTASGRINLGGPSTGAPPPASEGGTEEEEEEEEEMPEDLATLSPEEQQKMIKRRYVWMGRQTRLHSSDQML